jgi:hypothetical protein
MADMYGQRVRSIEDENRSAIQVTAKMSTANLEQLRGDGARHLISQVFHYVSRVFAVRPAFVRRACS